MIKLIKLIEILADGQFYSGQYIGSLLKVTRSSIWKMVAKAKDWGIEIDSVKGKGYRINGGLQLLDKKTISSALPQNIITHFSDIEIFTQIDSTNTYLMQKSKQEPFASIACFAEQQTKGRGRRGRVWYSPFGRNIYLSVLQKFDFDIASLGGLSLAVAVSVAQELRLLGVDCWLKWPNDILFNGHKLAGILVEISGDINGPCQVVVGVGINIKLSNKEKILIDKACISLEEIGINCSRNELAAKILTSVTSSLLTYKQTGLASFLDKWRKYDIYTNQFVQIKRGEEILDGRYLGIDNKANMILKTTTGTKVFNSGEVSLIRK